MMHFHHQRDIAVTQTLHQVHLPQRQRAIEQAPRHFADEFGELASATGRGKGRAVQVVVERKIGILQPVRIAEAQRTQSLAFRSLASFLLGYDVLITPGASDPLPTIEEVNRREAALAADNTRFAMDEYDFDRMPKPNINTPITWTAHPVASIPAGRGPDGLPFGLQLIGRYRDDIRLLRIALALETVLAGQTGFGRVLPALEVAA